MNYTTSAALSLNNFRKHTNPFSFNPMAPSQITTSKIAQSRLKIFYSWIEAQVLPCVPVCCCKFYAITVYQHSTFIDLCQLAGLPIVKKAWWRYPLGSRILSICLRVMSYLINCPYKAAMIKLEKVMSCPSSYLDSQPNKLSTSEDHIPTHWVPFIS